MKRLIICADGTWNQPDRVDRDPQRDPDRRLDQHWVRTPTNVVKMARAILPTDQLGITQVVFYDAGVGTGWGLLDPILGGAFGRGISRNIIDCYRFLVQNYDPGDEIYLFGFSRGATTVRSLAGLLGKCGLLTKGDAYYIPEGYGCYKMSTHMADLEPPIPRWLPGFARRSIARRLECRVAANCEELNRFRNLPFRRRNETVHEGTVKCIGVWDTVGSLGVPIPGPLGRWVNLGYAFHNVRLGSNVENAYQALAIDERRVPFAPTLWQSPEEAAGQHMEQVWFAGVHGNVGGGYRDGGLANHALDWMADKAESHGLALDREYLGHYRKNQRGELRQSMTWTYRLLGQHIRPIGEAPSGNERVHLSAILRHKDPPQGRPYIPSNLMAYLEANPPSDPPGS